MTPNANLMGHRIHVEHPRPRYVLPDDVPPPTGMTREEFADWSLRVCGSQQPILRDNEVYQVGSTFCMNAATYERLRKELRTEDIRAPNVPWIFP